MINVLKEIGSAPKHLKEFYSILKDVEEGAQRTVDSLACNGIVLNKLVKDSSCKALNSPVEFRTLSTKDN